MTNINPTRPPNAVLAFAFGVVPLIGLVGIAIFVRQRSPLLLTITKLIVAAAAAGFAPTILAFSILIYLRVQTLLPYRVALLPFSRSCFSLCLRDQSLPIGHNKRDQPIANDLLTLVVNASGAAIDAADNFIHQLDSVDARKRFSKDRKRKQLRDVIRQLVAIEHN